MKRNTITVLSRDGLDLLHIRHELKQARAGYQADPNPANKARYLQACREALTWAMAEAGIDQPEGLIDDAVATLDTRYNSQS